MQLRFSGFVLDPERFELRRGRERLPIEPKPLRLLLMLASRPGQVVAGEELRAALWPDVAVEHGSLHRAVAAARRTLVAAGAEPGLVRAVRGRGYQLASAVESVAARARADPFVGRRRELRSLQRALAAALGGAGGVILVSGEAGIGKTRLADELGARARARGATVLWGRAFELGEAPPYGPWRQVVGAWAEACPPDRMTAALGLEAPELAVSFPELAAKLGELPPPVRLDPVETRYRLFESVAHLLARATHAEPWLVLLDDLHAADLPSVLLLRHLARELRGLAVLVVATLRPSDVPAALTRPLEGLRREPSCEALELGPLSERESRSLVARLGQRASVGALVTRSDGNPFFLRELVRDARLGVWQPGVVPRSVRQMIDLRVAALSAASRRALAAACVLGARFGLAQLAAVSGVAVERLLRALAEAERAGLVVVDPEPPGSLRFLHALVSDAIYAGIDPLLRARLHRRAARVLEALAPAGLGELEAELARHLLGAGGPGELARAAEHAARAAEHAASLGAFEVAARHYALALEASADARSGDDARRCDLLLRRAEALERMGDAAQAVRGRKQALGIARDARLVEPFAEAACALVNENVLDSDDAERRQALEEALARDGLSDALRARVLAGLRRQLTWTGELAARRTLHAEALAAARRAGDRATLLSVFSSDPLLTLTGDDVERSLRVAEWRGLARELHDVERECLAWLLAVSDRIASADAAGIERELAGFERRVEELRHPRFRYWVAVAHAARALWRGPLAEAETLVARARALSPPVDEQPAALGTWHMQVLQLRMLQGRGHEEAPRFIQEAVAAHPSMGLIASMHPLALVAAGRSAEARAVLEPLVDHVEAATQHPGRLFSLAMLSEALARLGDAGRARRLYDLLLPHADRYAAVYASLTHGSVSRQLGLLAGLLGHPEQAARHFEEALRVERRLEAWPWLALTELDHARLLRTQGNLGARRHAAAAARLASAAGMPHVVASAARFGGGATRGRRRSAR